MQNQRAGLALANGNIYMGFASRDDQPPYQGWVLAYSASTLAQTGVYADTTIGTARAESGTQGRLPPSIPPATSIFRQATGALERLRTA